MYAGIEIARSLDRARITLRMSQKVANACREHVPAVVDGDQAAIAKLGLLKGRPLRKALDELKLAPPPPPKASVAAKVRKCPETTRYQSAVGSMRFPTELLPRFELALSRCSAVAARPPPEAMHVIRSVLAEAYHHAVEKREGITLGGGVCDWVPRPEAAPPGEMRVRGDGKDEGHGGSSHIFLHDGAPRQTEAHGDATWSRLNDVPLDDLQRVLHEAPADVYSMLITRSGGAVYTRTKRLGVVTGSSMEAERVPTVKLSEAAEYSQAIETALGNEVEPILITSDNSPNQRTAEGEASASRARHMLRRYLMVQQRVANGVVVIRHVSDEENPAGFLTKWVDAKKFDASIAYVTNSANAVDATPKALIDQAHAAFLAALARVAKEDEHYALEHGTTARVMRLEQQSASY